jgi:hypothetical protein
VTICYPAVMRCRWTADTLWLCWFPVKMTDLDRKSLWRALLVVESAMLAFAGVTRYVALPSNTGTAIEGLTYHVIHNQAGVGRLVGFLILAALLLGSAVLGISTGGHALAGLIVELLVLGFFAPAIFSGDIFYFSPTPFIATSALAGLVLSSLSLRGQRTASKTT